MCQVIEHITIKATGHRQTRQETIPCQRGQRGSLCSNVVRRSTEYYPDASSTSSRESNGPFTPPTVDGPGYKTEIHRPSSSTSSGAKRPSVVTPGVVIEIGGRSGTRIYPKAPKSYNKRSSFGGASTHSNEAVLDSPNSDKFRTGFPEAPFAPSAYQGHSDSYSYGHAPHRHTPSISSQTTPSLVHSLPPEPDSPSGRRTSRYSAPMIHNGPPAAPSSTAASRAAQPSSSATSSRANYRTETIAPRFTTNNYDDFVPRPSASTHSSSGRDEAPEITMRGAYREEQRAERKRRDEADRRQEERMEKEEKQVRFVDDRDKYRNDQRAEKAYAEAEKSRALAREEIRQENEERRQKEIRRENERRENEERRRKEEKHAKKDSEKRATKKPERTKTKPPTGYENITGGRSRRRSSVSMTQEDRAEFDRLRQGELEQQQREREASQQWEHEDQMTAARAQYAPRPTPTLSQQQEAVGYYNTRGNGSSVSRRGSISRRDSVSYTTPVITQPAPPLQQTYHTRPGSSSQYSSATYTPSSSRPSARHSSYQHENPFAQPPTRTSDTTISSQDPTNPFAAPSDRPIHPSSILQPAPAPWDNSALRDSLPPVSASSAYPRQGQNPLYMAGQQVINRSGDPTAHRRAQAATHNINRAVNADTAFESDSSSEMEHERTRSSRHGAKLGSGKGKKRRS